MPCAGSLRPRSTRLRRPNVGVRERHDVAWEQTVIDAADAAGLLGLALLTFTEAIIHPIPPDLLVLPMAAAADGPTRLLSIWLVATLTSVAGAIVGAWFGARAGRPLLVRFQQEKNLQRLEVLLERYGTVGVLIAGFTPIPYKVMGWAAGMGKMEMRPFVLAGLASRGLRFGLEVILVVQYGSAAMDAIRWILDREILLALAMVLMFGAAWMAWRWWESLTPEASTEEA